MAMQFAYNAQTAVDAEHKLIVAFELTNEGNDHRQLYPMAVQAKHAVGADEVTVVADTSYSNGEHAARASSKTLPPSYLVPRRSIRTAKQYFSRDRFSYDRESDSWRCPAGDTLSLPQDVPYPEQERVHDDGVRQLSAEAAMYRGGPAGHRAPFLRGCARGHAPAGDHRSPMDEASAGNRRTPLRDDQMADGLPPLPGRAD